MEIVVQIIGELLGSLVSVAVGIALGSVAFVAMLAVRRTHAHISRSTEIEDPSGEVWSVRVVYGLGRRVSTRLAGMSPEARRERRRTGHGDASVAESEIWHPKRLLDAFDEAAGLVAPLVVVAAAGIAVLFVVELFLAIPLGLVFLLASAARGRWQVEVVDPNGSRSVLDSPSLAEARDSAAQTGDRIKAGLAA